jgi:hypothetical protein
MRGREYSKISRGRAKMGGDVGTVYNQNFALVTVKLIMYRENVSVTTVANLLTVSIYVAYRSPHPDEATVNAVKECCKRTT